MKKIRLGLLKKIVLRVETKPNRVEQLFVSKVEDKTIKIYLYNQRIYQSFLHLH